MGNSKPDDATPDLAAVHPHVHGELYLQGDRCNAEIGSSPRAWGTLQPRKTEGQAGRFIPTCMGNSEETRPQL